MLRCWCSVVMVADAEERAKGEVARGWSVVSERESAYQAEEATG